MADASRIEAVFALLALGVTIFLAYRQIKKQRAIAADRATLNFIATHEIHNADWRRIAAVFYDWMGEGSPPPWLELLEAAPDRAKKDAVDVYSYLNHFELVAIAIEEGIVSESLYVKWYRSSYIETWKLAEDFVRELRKRRENPAIYRNFQTLAESWETAAQREGGPQARSVP